MSRELYPALSGAFGAWRQLETIANNVANAETTGFKAELLVYESAGPRDAYARISDGTIDQTTGTPMPTGDPLHVALQGPGFLVVEATGDVPWLTRDGQIHVDPSDGTLRTASGHVVQGEDGPIAVPAGEVAHIEADGTVLAGDLQVGRLRVVGADVEPLGGNLWRARGPLVEQEPTLVTGALEQSNVDTMRSMVDLIAASRTFEMVQKVMETSDELDARLNEFARA
ncbi:MAG: flagellar hook-basal body complex protein [Myxococcota bacterium]